MECPYCGNLNPAGADRCEKCSSEVKARTGMKTASFPTSPQARPAPVPPPPPPEPARREPDPGARQPSRDETPQAAVRSGAGKDPGDAAGAPQAGSDTHARAQAEPGFEKRMSKCDVCKGVFPVKDLVDFGSGYVCETCLEKKPKLLEKTAVKLKQIKDRTAPASGREIDRDRDTKDTYLHHITYIKNYEERTGKAPSSTTLLWPKCYKHPDRSTRDRCSRCKKPVCAMCTRKRAELVYCPECFGRSSQMLKTQPSGKYSGFSGSFFDTIREPIFGTAVYFRNLPSSGRVVQPFLFSMLAWCVGSIHALFVMWFAGFRPDPFDLDVLMDNMLKPLLFGGLTSGMLIALTAWIPVHFLARIMGSTESANKTFRLFCLSSGYHFLFVIPFAGWPIGVLSSFVVFPKALAESHGVGVFKAFAIYILFASMISAACFGVASFLFTV